MMRLDFCGSLARTTKGMPDTVAFTKTVKKRSGSSSSNNNDNNPSSSVFDCAVQVRWHFLGQRTDRNRAFLLYYQEVSVVSQPSTAIGQAADITSDW